MCYYFSLHNSLICDRIVSWIMAWTNETRFLSSRSRFHFGHRVLYFFRLFYFIISAARNCSSRSLLARGHMDTLENEKLYDSKTTNEKSKVQAEQEVDSFGSHFGVWHSSERGDRLISHRVRLSSSSLASIHSDLAARQKKKQHKKNETTHEKKWCGENFSFIWKKKWARIESDREWSWMNQIYDHLRQSTRGSSSSNWNSRWRDFTWKKWSRAQQLFWLQGILISSTNEYVMR